MFEPNKGTKGPENNHRIEYFPYTMADNKFIIMTDVSVCQTEGFQAVWRFLRPFRNLQIMTH
jgi:hypothetical protein